MHLRSRPVTEATPLRIMLALASLLASSTSSPVTGCVSCRGGRRRGWWGW